MGWRKRQGSKEALELLMYFLWHSEALPPVVLIGLDEVKTYIMMMRAVCGQTPRWCEVPEDFMEGANI